MKTTAVFAVVTLATALAFLDYVEREAYQALALYCARQPDRPQCERLSTAAGINAPTAKQHTGDRAP